jgi:hypothetical protein
MRITLAMGLASVILLAAVSTGQDDEKKKHHHPPNVKEHKTWSIELKDRECGTEGSKHKLEKSETIVLTAEPNSCKVKFERGGASDDVAPGTIVVRTAGQDEEVGISCPEKEEAKHCRYWAFGLARFRGEGTIHDERWKPNAIQREPSTLLVTAADSESTLRSAKTRSVQSKYRAG